MRTTPNKFIISFDKHLVDEEIFAQFLEQSKLNFIPKESKKTVYPIIKFKKRITQNQNCTWLLNDLKALLQIQNIFVRINKLLNV